MDIEYWAMTFLHVNQIWTYDFKKILLTVWFLLMNFEYLICLSVLLYAYKFYLSFQNSTF